MNDDLDDFGLVDSFSETPRAVMSEVYFSRRVLELRNYLIGVIDEGDAPEVTRNDILNIKYIDIRKNNLTISRLDIRNLIIGKGSNLAARIGIICKNDCTALKAAFNYEIVGINWHGVNVWNTCFKYDP